MPDPLSMFRATMSIINPITTPAEPVDTPAIAIPFPPLFVTREITPRTIATRPMSIAIQLKKNKSMLIIPTTRDAIANADDFCGA